MVPAAGHLLSAVTRLRRVPCGRCGWQCHSTRAARQRTHQGPAHAASSGDARSGRVASRRKSRLRGVGDGDGGVRARRVGRECAAAAWVGHCDLGSRLRRWSSAAPSRFVRCAARGIRGAARVRAGANGSRSVREPRPCGFQAGHPRRLWRVFALDLALSRARGARGLHHARSGCSAIAARRLSQAIVFEALNRVITAAFKFVPFRVGIDEASAGALAPILSVNPAAGVALAVVRK